VKYKRKPFRVYVPRLDISGLTREKDCHDRPLIFIGIGFGGLVLLKVNGHIYDSFGLAGFMLTLSPQVVSNAYHDSAKWPGILDAIRGIITLGTPFRGADGMSQSEMVQAAAREYSEEDIETEPIHILDPGNELLQDLLDDFQSRVWANMPQARMACFYELQSTEIGAIVGDMRRKVRGWHRVRAS
jgi:hypothetical protein